MVGIRWWRVNHRAITRSTEPDSQPLRNSWRSSIPILVQARLIPEGFRTGSLDGLNDALGGWFNEQATDEDCWPPGEPASFFVRWKNSATSRERLSMSLHSIADKKRELEKFSSDPIWAAFPFKKESERRLRMEIRQMKQGIEVDPTVFELVVDIFRDHAPGGVEMENEVSGVVLPLE